MTPRRPNRLIRLLAPLVVWSGLPSPPFDAQAADPAPAPAQVRPSPPSRVSIDWVEWGPAAFRRAQTLDRPILLSVVVSWSRQCRQMESTWSDPQVASLVNEGYVPVRVDADRHPEVRERYPVAEWPANTLLLPDGNPVFFSPREGKGDPARVRFGLLPPEKLGPILQEALVFYKTRKGALLKAVEGGLKAEEERRVEPAVLDREAPRTILDGLRANFDSLHGGWTKAPKFPIQAPIEALLFFHARDKDAVSLSVADRALRGIIEGELFDRVDGGIHRLAMGEDWSRPEYEKLLDRNVALLDNLLSAHLLTSVASYADAASAIIRFLDGTLRREGGGYYASQASDPSSADGGAYYRASSAERRKMKTPAVDRIVLVGWSAKAAVADLRASVLLGRGELAPRGRETLDWILANVYRRGRGIPHAVEGDATTTLPVYLEDQALFAEAMLDAYQLTGEKRYRQAAEDTVRFAMANLWSPEHRLFADIIPEPEAPLPLRRRLHPFEANSRMARLLARLFYLNGGEGALREGSSSILSVLTPVHPRMGPAAAHYALAASEFHEGPLWVWVIGSPTIPGYLPMLAEANRLPTLWKVVVALDPLDDGDVVQRLGLVRIRPPAVYLTSGTHTSAPAQFPHEVNEIYRKLGAFLLDKKNRATERERGGEPPASQPSGDGIDH